MEQTAYFIRRPRRIEELRDFGIGMLRPYRIVSTVCLGGMDYENFVTDLLADRAFLENAPGCGEAARRNRPHRLGCTGLTVFISLCFLRRKYSIKRHGIGIVLPVPCRFAVIGFGVRRFAGHRVVSVKGT